MHASILLSLLPFLVSLTSALPQPNHAPTSVPSNSESENFDRQHGKQKKRNGDNVASGVPEQWIDYAEPRPDMLPASKGPHGNHKRYDAMPPSMLSGVGEDWSTHGDHKFNTLPTSTPSSEGNQKRQESIPTGAPSYWSNHDKRDPNPSHGKHKRDEIAAETQTSFSTRPIPTSTSVPEMP